MARRRVGHDEQRGVEPRLRGARLEHGSCPPALFGVSGEGAVVDLEPGGFVDADREPSHVHCGGPLRPAFDRKRDLHLEELARRTETGNVEDGSTQPLAAAMHADRRPDGSPVWTPLVAVSLLIWFVLAMQCMSTVAIVRRETGFTPSAYFTRSPG